MSNPSAPGGGPGNRGGKRPAKNGPPGTAAGHPESGRLTPSQYQSSLLNSDSVVPSQADAPSRPPYRFARLVPGTARARALVVALVVLVVAAAIVFAVPWPTSSTPSAAPPASARPPVSSVRPSSSAAPPSDDGNPVGNDLVLTVESINDIAGGASAVFPADQSAAAGRFMDQVTSTPDKTLEGMAATAAAAGGYLYGGVQIFLSVQAKDGRVYTIYDIHPVVRHQVPVTAEAVLIQPQGEEPPNPIDFDLDQVFPEGKQDAGIDLSTDKPFFDGNRPEVTKQEKPTFTLWFNAWQFASTFTVDVDYDVDGKKYTQVLSNGGNPFRATVAPCANLLQMMSQRTQQQAPQPQQHYDEIWNLSVNDLGHFQTMSRVDYDQQCDN